VPDIAANGISLHYESLGNENDPPILLIMGLAAQMILWPDAFCQMLVEKGFRVIRFDNRDVGLSTHLDHLGVPNVALEYAKFMMRLPMKSSYLIDDMAADTAALIDALGLKRPHVVGASMGGMIAQNLAANYPDKVATLTSIMSTTGRRSRAIMQPPAKRGDTQGAIDRMVHVFNVISSKTYPPDPAYMRDVCTRHIMRANYPPGGARQLMAIAASDDRTYIVRKIKAPTLVLHGDEDKLVSPVCGMETAREIVYGGGKARVNIIKGMGHDLPAPLLGQIAEEIAGHCRAV
jgi:pimeloyl-ACP methyl ester carboxylesterase